MEILEYLDSVLESVGGTAGNVLLGVLAVLTVMLAASIVLLLSLISELVIDACGEKMQTCCYTWPLVWIFRAFIFILAFPLQLVAVLIVMNMAMMLYLLPTFVNTLSLLIGTFAVFAIAIGDLIKHYACESEVETRRRVTLAIISLLILGVIIYMS